MRVLDKKESPAPWEQMSAEQQKYLVESKAVAPWMFEKLVVLTVCDDDGNVQQFGEEIVSPGTANELLYTVEDDTGAADETVSSVEEDVVPTKETVWSRVRAKFTREK